MKKILFILIAFLLLVGCSNGDTSEEAEETEDIEVEGVNADDEEQSQEVEATVEVVAEQEHNIVLADNDDLKITLTDSLQERVSDYETKDILFLDFSVENKKNRTFTILIDDISIDGDSRDYDIGMTETEIEPEEQKIITANLFLNVLEDNKEITFEEHLSGKVTYIDFEGNREQIVFSEYINE